MEFWKKALIGICVVWGVFGFIAVLIMLLVNAPSYILLVVILVFHGPIFSIALVTLAKHLFSIVQDRFGIQMDRTYTEAGRLANDNEDRIVTGSPEQMWNLVMELLNQQNPPKLSASLVRGADPEYKGVMMDRFFIYILPKSQFREMHRTNGWNNHVLIFDPVPASDDCNVGRLIRNFRTKDTKFVDIHNNLSNEIRREMEKSGGAIEGFGDLELVGRRRLTG